MIGTEVTAKGIGKHALHLFAGGRVERRRAMPEIIVKIEYDSPEDPYWLNPDNVAVALSAYCRNTRFKCEWAEHGNPWEDKDQNETFPAQVRGGKR